MVFSFGRNKSIEERQEENERLDIELSIEQKRALMRKLKADGLSVNKTFGGSMRAAWLWFKSH